MIFNDLSRISLGAAHPRTGRPQRLLELSEVSRVKSKSAPTNKSDFFESQIIRNDPETIQESSSNDWSDVEDPESKRSIFIKNGPYF